MGDDEVTEPYTVKDLIADLQKLNPDLPVLLQKDPEGNGFFWASGADADAYVPDEAFNSDRSDECRNLADLQSEAEDDDDPTDGYQQVVVVFP